MESPRIGNFFFKRKKNNTPTNNKNKCKIALFSIFPSKDLCSNTMWCFDCAYRSIKQLYNRMHPSILTLIRVDVDVICVIFLFCFFLQFSVLFSTFPWKRVTRQLIVVVRYLIMRVRDYKKEITLYEEKTYFNPLWLDVIIKENKFRVEICVKQSLL